MDRAGAASFFTNTATTTTTPTTTTIQRQKTRLFMTDTTTTTTTPTTEDNDKKSEEGLFLFDFDGVVCDSCDECTVSAFRTCHQLGVLLEPKDDNDNDNNNKDYPPPWLFDKMREIRPAIEVGWQIPVLLSVFLEQQQQQQQPPMTVPEIIQNYAKLVQEWLEKHKLSENDMIDTFGGIRDSWIANDLSSWLEINTFYKGVPEAFAACNGTAILVTTKQQRFAIALCRHAGIDSVALPDERIYGLGMYKSKSDVIVHQMETGGYAPTSTRFFEDRWPTLAKCLKDDRLKGVQFYLCDWGYVTPHELELAQAEPRVEVISLDDFSKIVTS